MAFVPLAAKNAKVRIGNAIFTAKEWNVIPKADKLDSTNFESGGFAQSAFGIGACEIEIIADWDRNQNPFDNPVALQPGLPASNVRLYLNDIGSPNWYIPTLNVFEAPNNAQVRQLVGVRIRGEANGAFFFPIGIA